MDIRFELAMLLVGIITFCVEGLDRLAMSIIRWADGVIDD